ncbi:hypothetical protein SAMN02745121_05654 [Nannocystis exedens]|uniref:Uncharacterized protein n=1 Tax=Nannocystis exedens TaxID=54 RepID=A0A1I2DP67_9BACT|nr:hypothetical protein [Nannocystis exedens]PCC69013.1 hypothetical protein NAEX_02035 [Nannocystis exedens]SFE82286.1 hypothetical protein SAMN02745121_05654 [Nannocystis exedens]
MPVRVDGRGSLARPGAREHRAAKRVRRVLPRASGQLVGLAVAPGHFLAVATAGNKFKIDFVPWSELAG